MPKYTMAPTTSSVNRQPSVLGPARARHQLLCTPSMIRLHELLDRLLAPSGLGALGVVGFLAQRLVRVEHVSVRLIDDLDVDRDLQMPARRDRLLRIRAEATGTSASYGRMVPRTSASARSDGASRTPRRRWSSRCIWSYSSFGRSGDGGLILEGGDRHASGCAAAGRRRRSCTYSRRGQRQRRART